MKMQTTTMRITPAIAREMLTKNTNNRPIRKANLEVLRDAMARGKFLLTHQGISFSDTGILLDGQHRLHALAQLPDHMSIEMQVTTGQPEATFNVIDRGLMRTLAEAMREDTRLTSAARTIATTSHNSLRSGATADLVMPYVAIIKDVHDELMSLFPSQSKTWASASVRAAAVTAILRGYDRNYVHNAYGALVATDYNAMEPVVQALHKGGTRNQSMRNNVNMIARCLVAFNPRKANLTRIAPSSLPSVPELLRATYDDQVRHWSGVLDVPTLFFMTPTTTGTRAHAHA